MEQALVDKGENDDENNLLIKLPYTTPDHNLPQPKPVSKLVVKFLKGAKEGIKL